MELDDATYNQLQKLTDSANSLIDRERYEQAIGKLNKALELLPEPKNDWEASTWINATIGDAHYLRQDYESAKEALFDALNGPDGQTNAFIHLRLGQVLFELDESEQAVEHLLRAYMLKGKQIFRGEPKKYLAFLKDHVAI